LKKIRRADMHLKIDLRCRERKLESAVKPVANPTSISKKAQPNTKIDFYSARKGMQKKSKRAKKVHVDTNTENLFTPDELREVLDNSNYGILDEQLIAQLAAGFPIYS
jgi:hypothetical protein